MKSNNFNQYKRYRDIDMEANGNHLNDKQSIKEKYWIAYEE